MAVWLEDANAALDFINGKGGVKGLVESGISEVPDAFIQPPDQRIPKVLKMISEPIDLSKLDGPSHDEVVKSIVKAAETIGFFQVVNHGVPLELLDSLMASANRFFDLTPQEKAVYIHGVSPSPFVSYGTSFLPKKYSAFCWRDYLHMDYENDEQALQHWPKECSESGLNYLNSSMKMVKKIMEVLLQNLGLPRDNKLVDSLIYPRSLHLNFYPACPNANLTAGVGEHTDLNTLTVLLEDGTGGLQVKLDESLVDNEGQWVEISPISGALIINIGDTLQIISNGQYKSAQHRARTPDKSEQRVSVPLFITPQLKEKIGPLPQLVKRDGVCRYPMVVYDDYMKDYFRMSREGKKKSIDHLKLDSST